MHLVRSAAALGLALAAAPVLADPPVIQPVQVGGETVRYRQGVPTVDLRLAHGAVQIRPLPFDHGSLAFSVAVFNGGSQAANIDVANFTAEAGDQHLAAFTVDQLMKKAKNRAMWSQIGIAALGGLSAAAAASQRDTYTGSLYTPHGAYHSVYSAPSAMGQVQAMAITAGTAYGVVEIQNRLDQTLERLGNDVVQVSTIDPGTSYAGKIVLEKVRSAKLPQRVTLMVNWNGEQYPFAFQVAKAGTPAPMFTALTPAKDAGEGGMAAAPAGAPAPAPGPVPAPAPAPAGPEPVAGLDQIVRRTAELMPSPTELDDGTAIRDFAASGNELTLTATASGTNEDARHAASRAICNQRALSQLLHQGATVRAVFVPGKGAAKGSAGEDLVLTGKACGFS